MSAELRSMSSGNPAPVWPTATPSMVAEFEQLEAHHEPEELNQPLFALLRARKALNDARLSLHRARMLNRDKVHIAQRLESVAADVVEAMGRLPLTIEGQPLVRKPDNEWAQAPAAPESFTVPIRKRAIKLERPLTPAEANAALHAATQRVLGVQ